MSDKKDLGAAAMGNAQVGTKKHFVMLDGLRGVASLLVVAFHLFEAFAQGDPHRQIINHGYLAVDFFFLLSGFVIAYAYDDRWGRMSQWQFYRRRLIRLQPMIIAGTLFGAALFGFQNFSIFPKVADATPLQIAIVAVLGCLMIPLPKAFDIRGWDETYPLNGPAWSLFYEYVANIFYATVLRRLSNWGLAVLLALAAVALVDLAVFGGRGDLIGGWALDADGLRIGFTRVAYPFLAGILLMRLGKRVPVKGAFGVCSVLLVVALSVPRFGGTAAPWLNGLYEAVCIMMLFPLIVAIGAGHQDPRGPSLRIARFFGDLSYPLYITHYPLIYIFTGWVADRKVPPGLGAIVGLGVFFLAIAAAIAWLKLFDEPLRRWLTERARRADKATGELYRVSRQPGHSL
ncbi:acyltransferase [Novosphingobium sp. BL-8A]|uniref:acyltransferase family protein n=1 Tax=Novosphingobium sp. BL-8A TaxID=3127639 RepID=UPI003757E7A3